MEEVKQQRATAKSKFTRKVKLFEESLAADDPEVILKSKFDEVCEAFRAVEGSHDQFVYRLDNKQEDYQSELDKAEQYILQLERVKSDKHSKLVKHIKCKTDKQGTRVKVKSLDPPTFSGNIRDYPTFRKDFERLVTNNYGEDPYALKSCLIGDALAVVKGVEDSFSDMVERLDNKFGDSVKITDAVISEIKSLKPIVEGSPKKFVDMVNTVERCWLDLKKMGLSSEMNTTTMVTQVERLLPLTQKRDWVLIAQDLTDRSKLFEELLKFLLREKRVIEYMETDLRVTSSSKAMIHNYVSEEPAEVTELVAAIKQLHESQESHQKQMHACMVNMTRNMTDLISNVVGQSKSHELGTNSKRLETRQCTGQARKCWFHDSDTHDITECAGFHRLNNQDKFEMIRVNNVCFCCLHIGHLSNNCPNKRMCEVRIGQTGVCGRLHHHILHNMFNYSNYPTYPRKATNNFCSYDGVLLMISKVRSKNQTFTTLWDPGSNVTMITHRMAKQLGLKGRDVNLAVTKVGNFTEKFESKEYLVPLIDDQGKLWEVIACGINEITAEVAKINTDKVAKLFGVLSHDIERPIGQVDMLVGSDNCGLLPIVRQTMGNLQLMRNQFGYCLRGSHPSLNCTESKISSSTRVRILHITCELNVNDINIGPKLGLTKQLDAFFAVENLGTCCYPKCGNCKCGGCPIGANSYSIREERELNLINQGLSHNQEAKRWTATYPWIKDPRSLPNNQSVAIARLYSTEKRLWKLGSEYSKAYQEEMEGMVNRKVARKLEPNELCYHTGPVHYIPHHEVLKPGSSSTPLRIVFNSSSAYMGHVINDYWAKGPDILNNMLGILLRFRQEKVAIVGDIAKMYNTVGISELDQHTHRFVWRDMETNRKPDHYVLTAVTFGDRPSGAIAMMALRRTAEMSSRDSRAAKMIIKNSYVDDILQSVHTTSEAKSIIQETERILDVGGFKIKHWIMSGDNEGMREKVNFLDTKKEKILGLYWKPKEDKFNFEVKINFSNKYKKVYIGPNIEVADIDYGLPTQLTKRMVLSQTASVYDPLGLIIPFTVQSKILMRELVSQVKIWKNDKEENLGWDDPMPDCMYKKWKSLFKDMYCLTALEFNRCVKPDDAVGDPMLVVFSDASSQAYGTCAYIRWELRDNRASCGLLAAKNRIAPTRQLTIPRLELCGAVLACRLREFIEKEVEWKFHSVIHILDSSIVRSQIQRESYGFGTFVATKIAEIQTKTDPNEWWWVPSNCNPADMTTRACHPNELGYDSVWQRGPEYLLLPTEIWPIKQTCEKELPDRIGAVMNFEAKTNTDMTNLQMVDLRRFSSYNRLIRTIARILSAFKERSLKGVFKEPGGELVNEAGTWLIKEVQKSICDDWKTRYQRLGPGMDEKGLIVVGQRMANWLKDNWNQDRFVLLPTNHKFTKLYIQHIHSIDHAGVEVTLAKLQTKFWVPRARKLIKSVKERCVTCRKLDKLVGNQTMGQLPSERLQPAAPFNSIAIDLFGPFLVKDTVKRRTKLKVYGVIFNCLASRAVYLDLTEGYDTENFLITFRRFVAIRGFPGMVHSDGGTQFVAANKELRAMVKGWNRSDILRFGASEGMRWSFNKSADAPWENGCSESLIKLVKRGMVLAIGDNILSFGELQTALFEVANLLNERPIGIKPGSNLDLGTYLCPNDLLLGRTSNKAPGGMWKDTQDTRKRLNFIERIVSSFWKKWQRDYFPTLVVRQKWHSERRNMQPGDIVLVQDSNTVRGSWKMAEIVSAEPGSDGKVRDVSVRYKTQKPGNKYDGQNDILVKRSVHRLVVILPVDEQI